MNKYFVEVLIMSIIIFAIISVILVSLVIVVIKSIASPKKVDNVRKLLKAGKNQAASKLAKQIVAKEPSNALAHYYLGKAYLADNRGELALIEFKFVNEHALFDNQLQEIPFRREFAALQLKFNQLDGALREYLLLTKMDPHTAENFFRTGEIYEKQNRKDLALSVYKKCLALDPKNAKAHASVGYILFQAKQLNEAKKELDLAIRLNPETYSCYYYLGKLLKEAKDFGAAVKAFDKAQRDSEFKQKALIERATCYMMANRLDNAQIDLQRAIELDKDGTSNDTLYARYFLAACFEKTRKIEKAIEQWDLIYNKNRSFRDVANKLQEYKDLQSNDSLKDYLTCSDTEFIEVCKSVITKTMNMTAQQAESKKFGCEIMATDTASGDWMNMRKQMYLIRFYREPEPLEDTPVREALDKAKSSNCAKTLILASSGFTRPAQQFAENRPIELIGKEKLQNMLSKASS